MYRIQYLLGSMAVIFSLVYCLFGITSWLSADASSSDVLVCFVLTSIHFIAGIVLLARSRRDYRRESYIMNAAFEHLVAKRGGRVVVAELADAAGVSIDDAREYLYQRSSDAPMFRDVDGVSQESYIIANNYRNN